MLPSNNSVDNLVRLTLLLRIPEIFVTRISITKIEFMVAANYYLLANNTFMAGVYGQIVG